MKFDFYTNGCSAKHAGEAVIRESTRMCAIAYGLDRQGHDVRIVDAPRLLKDSPRWRFFRHLHGGPARGLRVVPAEIGRGDIGIKCSVGVERDRDLASRFSLLVAHEYDARCKALRVPFLIHNNLMDGLVELGLFVAYLDNNVDVIRESFPCNPNGRVAFCGKNWRHRVEALKDAPDWVDVTFYDTPPMSGVEHAKWICGYSGGICLPGDTPKTRLPPMLALLGVPIVMWPISRVDTPPIDSSNALMFESWGRLKEQIDDEFLLDRIIYNATHDYIESWSPAGQARLIAEFFE